ncbi:PREDICTED: ankyrin repeat domain-containing protein SOWAHC isoform X2 [Drosophila arizonae]|uniref:Ankyrin repeat domain-containing protein SOWAHC isoform X2 n=1 Tax=Drosophila arizonae TaxID=7263 RepID=A0ABM1PA23_DROAR|nr:PREDICTED: ankyrin repeat domain-containing protein SOWAHC isoform X2 [Drosophila arizonae]
MSASDTTKQLSIVDIRNYMLQNDGKVTNHALVKHFKKYLTHTQNEAEARKRFKTYVTLLSTIKNENNQKYLILRKKYINECPSEEVVERAVAAAGTASAPSSPGAASIVSVTDSGMSPMRQPPPYKAPPEVQQSPAPEPEPSVPVIAGLAVHQDQVETYRECVNEFTAAMQRIDPARLVRQSDIDKKNEQDTETSANGNADANAAATADANGNINAETNADPDINGNAKSISRVNSVDEGSNKENIPRFSFSSGTSTDSSSAEKADTAENPISVKEATRKFNRMASEEEAKIISPPPKKKPEKLIEEKDSPDVTLSHPKAKEWIVAMAKVNYQELAKLANDYPELVKLQCPATGYTALHWAAKHGNEDVVKLIAGTYKADVNARTHGGYTPLHLATQFGRHNIFELLWNVYKANRDIMDWSGNKPLDYSQQRPSVSASTCSKIKARKKHAIEKDLGFLRIGSLNVRVKKTTEAFSNFLGVGNGNALTAYGPGGVSGAAPIEAGRHHQRTHRHHHQRHPHHANGTTRDRHPNQRASTTIPYGSTNVLGSRSSVPINRNIYDAVHKSWGSADNITQRPDTLMPPPKSVDYVSKRYKSSKRSSYASNATDSPRDSICSSNSSSNLNSGYSSMPTTPNQIRAPKNIGITADSDSDSACGFDSNWSVNGRNSVNNNILRS